MSFALLVFDLDGTLVPTMEDYADQAASLMNRHFGTEWDEARRSYFRTSGLPFEKQLLLLYPDRSETDAVAAQFEDWKDGYLDAVDLPDAVADLLHAWRGQGYRIAISSNNLVRYVERLARDWPVDHALGYCPENNFGKGEDHFAALEQHFDMARERFLFTGDSPNDARIARASRVEFRALLTSAFAPEDFLAIDPEIRILNHLGELLATLPEQAAVKE